MATYLIIEGPDGAGKTTLIASLMEQFGARARYHHFGVPVDHTKQYALYARTILNYEHTDNVVIFDRAWYSDRVYAPVMRNREEMTEDEAVSLDNLVQSIGGGLLIYCTANIDQLWERCTRRGEFYIQNIEQLQQISLGYERMLQPCALPVIRYDTSN